MSVPNRASRIKALEEKAAKRFADENCICHTWGVAEFHTDEECDEARKIPCPVHGAPRFKRAFITLSPEIPLMPAERSLCHCEPMRRRTACPLSEKLHERVGVYLTNALTGWNPPKGPKQKLMFSEMEEERDAAELVKPDKTILVVLGNPPYYAFAGVSPEEQGLVEPYKEGLATQRKIRKYNLDELYVRFLRLAERRRAHYRLSHAFCAAGYQNPLAAKFIFRNRERVCRRHDRISREAILSPESLKMWSSSTGLPGNPPVSRARTVTKSPKV